MSSDLQAVGTLGAISAAGLRCPEDISIAGFDDIELASHLGLTTMRQQMYEMVMWAAESLLARLEDPSQKPTQTLFVPKLVIRNTSKLAFLKNMWQARPLHRVHPRQTRFR